MTFPAPFWTLFAANLATMSSFAAFFLFPLFITEHGGGESEIGLLMGVFALAATLCRPWIAEMIDHYGRRRMHRIGSVAMLVFTLAYLLFLDHFSFWGLLLLRLLHGMALAVCFTSVFTYVADLLPASMLNRGLGIFGISGLVGMAGGPFLAEGAMRHGGFVGYFLFAATFTGISALFSFRLPESPQTVLAEGEAKERFFTLLKQRKFAVVAALSFLFGIAVAATSSFVSPLAQQRQIAVISSFFVAYSAGAIGIRLGFGGVTDRLGERRVIPLAQLIFSAGLLLLTFADSTLLLTLSGLACGLAHGILFPSLNTLAIRGEPFSRRGKATGIFTGALDAGTFSGALLLGAVGEWVGLSLLFTVAALAVLAGLLLLPLLRRTTAT